MFLFIIVIGLLLGLGAVYGLRRFRPEYVEIAATVIPGLTLLVWLAGRAALPLAATVSRWPAAMRLPPLAWVVDDVGWALTAWLLLLGLATLLVHLARVGRRAAGVERPTSLLPYFAILFVLTGALAVWPDSPAGLLGGWLLLNGAWIVGVLLMSGSGRDLNGVMMRGGVLFLSPFFLWLGASGAPAEAAAGWDFAELPAWAVASLVVAGFLQLGVFPLHWWRPIRWTLPAEWLALLHTVPAVAGIGLLARLAGVGEVAAGYRFLFTVLALLGVLVGGIWAWRGVAFRERDEGTEETAEVVPTNLGWVVGGLAVAQASWVGLVGVWAGGAAVLGEGRVLLLAIPALFLATYTYLGDGRRLWLAAGAVVAALALAGLPLTAGFAGRAALYNGWLAEGRFVLVLVAAVLHILLVAVLARLAWGWLYRAEARVDSDAMKGTEAWRPLVMGAALLLAALGLLTVSVAWGEIRLVSWLAVLLPVAAGVWLARSAAMIEQRWQAVAAGWQGNEWLANGGRLADGLKQLVQGVGATLREAAAILEGEGGLLWLLLLIVVFWLAQRG